MLHMEKPSALRALTAQNNVGSGKNDNIHNSETDPSAQAQNEPHSAAAAASIERNHKRLLGLKRGTLWSLANMAGASHDELMEALENCDDEEMIERGAHFIENVRCFAKLLADFRDARGAAQ
jgi:hypothetical protein